MTENAQPIEDQVLALEALVNDLMGISVATYGSLVRLQGAVSHFEIDKDAHERLRTSMNDLSQRLETAMGDWKKL